ncbi:hypothetical protein I6N95_05115 [Vagococcus sp. BWB3-3]|uniref:Uncharacterized protein n=1 Tax=Vagococcus allomyrinae TaxID=2794353 RepID=A0A940P955_9ENTE|nr:hypothetical protein [Vagococcus allomyrinae]MBP1040390.1 hypothetical protein [Vagococcus allomyrinae]
MNDSIYRSEKIVKIRILKDVFWEDWGTLRKVFKKGHICKARETFLDGESIGVSAESQFYEGVSDGLSDDEYEIIEEVAE